MIQRLVGMSLRTFATAVTSPNDDDSEKKLCQERAITPPSSPTFDGLAAPTPNTAMRAIKSSTFLHVSSLNPVTKAFATRSPGEIPSIVNEFLRHYPSRT